MTEIPPLRPHTRYAAHGKDILSYLFEIPLIVYLGNTSFGVYIAQQLLIDYKVRQPHRTAPVCLPVYLPVHGPGHILGSPAVTDPLPSFLSLQQWQNDQFLLANKYPRVWEFALLLTVMGAIGYHCIQLPYNPYITKVGPFARAYV